MQRLEKELNFLVDSLVNDYQTGKEIDMTGNINAKQGRYYKNYLATKEHYFSKLL